MVSESANCRSGRLGPAGRRTITILLTRASGRMLKRANLRVSAVARFRARGRTTHSVNAALLDHDRRTVERAPVVSPLSMNVQRSMLRIAAQRLAR
jgi:hypothetical protein